MKKLILICLALSTLILSACVEVRDPEKKEETQTETPRPVIEAEPKAAKVDLLVDEEMFIYQGQVLTMDQIEDLQYKKRKYRDGLGDIRQPIQWNPTNLTLTYGKIEITARGKLFTMGNDVILNVDELISNRGSIETMPPGTKASSNQPGMSGGYLTINARRGDGQLFITMRGQEGGNGINGTNGENFVGTARLGQCLTAEGHKLHAGAGSPGQPGGDTGSVRINGNIANLDYRIRREAGKGGAGGNPGTPTRCTDGGDYTEQGGHWLYGNPAAAGAPGADGKVLD